MDYNSQFRPQFQQPSGPNRPPKKVKKSKTDPVNYLIPLAIVVFGILIAAALIYVKTGSNAKSALTAATSKHPEENMAPVTSADHILGNPNATVVMVEYADTDCPYCQQFNKTLQRIVDEYGKTGQVSWVYRHFAFHPKAPKEAEATECAAELGGNDKFFQYVDALFEKKDFKQSPYVGLEVAQLPTIAGQIGIDQTAFSECLASGRYKQKVANSYDEAVKAGAQGTPYTILVTKNGKIPITVGAVSYDALHSAIVTLLNQNPQ